jgi:hypothetical protein
LPKSDYQSNVDPGNMRWKYWQPRPDRPGPRSYVLVDGSSIVAHGGLVPGSILWGDERTELVQMIDWVARSDNGARGEIVNLKRLSSR